MQIVIAKQFSSTPGGRFKTMGPDSGEQFREVLLRALKRKPAENVEVILDGAEGYGSSFLEEAFGGLVRSRALPWSEIASRLTITARTPEYRIYALEARQFMDEAAQKLNG